MATESTASSKKPNHYELLRLKPFETDSAVIRDQYAKFSEQLRKHLDGPQGEKAREQLDRLTTAMLCLTDRRRKRDYDASLGHKSETTTRGQSFDQILLARKVVDTKQLETAHHLASAIGVDLRDALFQQQLGRPEAVMLAYAESLGLPYVDLGDMVIDESLIPRLPAVVARQYSILPVMRDGDRVVVASPGPLRSETEEEIRLRFHAPVRTVLCTPDAINTAISKHYTRETAAAEIGSKALGGNKRAASSDRAARQGAQARMSPEEFEKRRKTFITVGFCLGFALLALPSSLMGVGASFALYGGALGLGALGAGIGWLLSSR